MPFEFVARNGLVARADSQISGSTSVTGSLRVTGSVVSSQFGFTGSLLGTASYVSGNLFTSANPALSASYAVTSSFAISSSFSATSSLTGRAITSSYPIQVTGSSLFQNTFSGQVGPYSTTSSVYFGEFSGISSQKSDYSNFFGELAGYQATSASNSNFFGLRAGYQATGAYASNFIGPRSGQNASGAYESNFMGNLAGDAATSAYRSNFIGGESGDRAINAYYSNFFGYKAGWEATNASSSNFIGTEAGYSASSAGYCNIIGYGAGYRTLNTNGIGRNNIIIGTNISLADNYENGINLGGLIFGSGSYFNATARSTGSANGRVGINQPNPQYSLDISGSAYASSGFTGSLFGTASYVTGSNFVAGNLATSASYAITASYALSSAGSSTAAGDKISSGSVTASVNIGNAETFRIISASSTFVYVSASGNVGIGTTTPSSSLHVIGAVVASSGMGAYIPALTASEALTAGDFVNIATGGVRRASSDNQARQAHGFVTAAASANNAVVVYQSGINASVTGLTAGARYFLSASGAEATTPTTRTGSISQEVGVALSSTALLVNIGPAILT